MRRTVAVVCLALLGACQPDDPARSSDRADDFPAAAPAGEAQRDAQPVRHRVFQQTSEEAGPPRETIHLLIQADASRDQLRVTLQKVINERAEQDSTLVAIRAIGYVGVAQDARAREANLTPMAWAEWLPPGGWHQATAESRDAVHRVYFYHGSPPPW